MDEISWLIELPTSEGAKWYTVNNNFTKDSCEAVRFSRKVDAEAAIKLFGLQSLTDVVATEHMWTA